MFILALGTIAGPSSVATRLQIDGTRAEHHHGHMLASAAARRRDSDALSAPLP
jgi:hypothetical protein